MKLGKLYEYVIDEGIKNDPRGRKKVFAELAQLKKTYEALSAEERRSFNKDRLDNPYPDTKIIHGDKDAEVQSILVGIDIDTSELVLADALRGKKKSIDLVFAHHPSGAALAGFYNVMYMQADILHAMGVPINVAEHLLAERIGEVERRVLPTNHMRAHDAARLLGIPFMCAHTAADNCVTSYLNDLFGKKSPSRVRDIVSLLGEVAEYKEAATIGVGPRIVCGSAAAKAGKIFVDMTGGTEGAKTIFSNLMQAGVGTMVCMHMSEEHLKNAREAHINVVIAGHISSDTLGVNLLLDGAQKLDKKITIIPCSGFRRFPRTRN